MELLENDLEDTICLGIHSLNESWLSFLVEEESLPKQFQNIPISLADEDNVTVFPYREVNLYGKTPILDKFSALSVFGGICLNNNKSSNKYEHILNNNSSSKNLEIPSYSGSNSSSSSTSSSISSNSINSSTISSKSRKRHLPNYEEIQAQDKKPDINSLLYPTNSYSNELDRNQLSRVKLDPEASIESKKITVSANKKRVDTNIFTNNKHRYDPTQTSARTSGIVTSATRLYAKNKAEQTRTDESVADLIVEVLINVKRCLTRPEPDPSKAEALTDISASVPPIADESLVLPAESPTKPTDEPALPDEQPLILIPSDLRSPSDLMNSIHIPSPSLILPVETDYPLIQIKPDEFSLNALKDQYPTLFTTKLTPNIIPADTAEDVKQFVKYDPFIEQPEFIDERYENSVEPKRKIVKFKFSPFNVIESDQSTRTELIKPSSTNLFIMELEEPVESQTLEPLPCGVYEIESTQPYYRITPDPGVYETNSSNSPTDSDLKVDKIKAELNSPTNFLFDDNGISWKLRSENCDFEYDQAPPTPQTPICMKRIHTDDEITFVNIFGGLYELVGNSDNGSLQQFRPDTKITTVRHLTNTQRYRPLIPKPRARSNTKIGSATTPNLMQDFQMNTTLKTYLHKINKNSRSRTNRTRT